MTAPDDSDQAAAGETKPKSKQTLAIALKDQPGARAADTAPQITATGRGKVAEQILAIAFEHGVKVREDADLAEILAVLEVDSVVPVEVLATISEILAYVYRANAALKEENEAP
jgi:flagellar biosynthesis protein